MAQPTSADALELLETGNARFVAGTPTSVANDQQPFAAVLGCSDSRVPVEIVFDQRLGSLFVVRVAGNIVNAEALGSIEFAVAILKCKLIVVLGHERCGAVEAAINYVQDGVAQPGHIQTLVDSIAPAARAARDVPGDWHDNTVARNVELGCKALVAGSKIIADAAGKANLQVIGGIYNLHSGRVIFS